MGLCGVHVMVRYIVGGDEKGHCVSDPAFWNDLDEMLTRSLLLDLFLTSFLFSNSIM